jgi:hypothetical protein
LLRHRQKKLRHRGSRASKAQFKNPIFSKKDPASKVSSFGSEAKRLGGAAKNSGIEVHLARRRKFELR